MPKMDEAICDYLYSVLNDNPWHREPKKPVVVEELFKTIWKLVYSLSPLLSDDNFKLLSETISPSFNIINGQHNKDEEKMLDDGGGNTQARENEN